MLAKDVTPRDLPLTARDAEDVVRQMVGAMNKERRARGQIVVRLGVTGTGKAPNYRFDAPDGTPLVPYNGADHKPWPPGERFDDPRNWSESSWSYDELAAYLGEIRAKVRPPR